MLHRQGYRSNSTSFGLTCSKCGFFFCSFRLVYGGNCIFGSLIRAVRTDNLTLVTDAVKERAAGLNPKFVPPLFPEGVM